METQVKNLPKSQVELSITLSEAEMEPYLDAAARAISSQQPIKGFRPGFAPKDIVSREFGPDKIHQAALDLAVQENYLKAVADKTLEPVAEPHITIEKQNQGLAFKAVIPVLPKIDLGDYKKIKVPAAEVKIEEKEVAEALENIRKSRAQNTVVARPAQKGDRVEIDFKVRKDGAIIDGGESQQHPLVLGEGHFMAGFENELAGLAENETKNFSLTAPADYHNKSLAGQKLDFEVKINSVQERKLPELNNDFAKSLGSFQNAEDLKNSVRDGLKIERELKAREERRHQIALKLIQDIKTELPDVLVDAEIEKMTVELNDSLAQMNLGLDNYLGRLKKSFEDLKKDWRPQAEDRVKIALALKEIARKENVQVSDEEVEIKLSQLLRSAPPLAPGQNLDLTALRGYVKSIIRNEKVFELLENN